MQRFSLALIKHRDLFMFQAFISIICIKNSTYRVYACVHENKQQVAERAFLADSVAILSLDCFSNSK